MDTRVGIDAHAESMRLDIHDLVRRLVENLGPTLVRAMTGVKDRGAPSQWAKPDGTEPRDGAQQRLRLGYRVWRIIEASDGPNVAAAWMAGANPRLDEATPVTFVRELRTREVVGAAQAFADDVVG